MPVLSCVPGNGDALRMSLTRLWSSVLRLGGAASHPSLRPIQDRLMRALCDYLTDVYARSDAPHWSTTVHRAQRFHNQELAWTLVVRLARTRCLSKGVSGDDYSCPRPVQSTSEGNRHASSTSSQSGNEVFSFPTLPKADRGPTCSDRYH